MDKLFAWLMKAGFSEAVHCSYLPMRAAGVKGLCTFTGNFVLPLGYLLLLGWFFGESTQTETVFFAPGHCAATYMALLRPSRFPR